MTEKAPSYELEPVAWARSLVGATADQTRANLLTALETLDLHGTPTDQGVDAKLSDLLWRLSSRAETVSFVDKCYMIHRLRQKVTGRVWVNSEMRDAEVERWQIQESETAIGLCESPKYNWEDFCGKRLNMDPGLTSGMKRVWEVFHLALGIGRDKLERAGKSSLRQAVGQVARDWQAGGIDDDLMALLFGSTYDDLGMEPTEGEAGGDLAADPATFEVIKDHVNSRRSDQPAAPTNTYEFSLSEPDDGGPRTLTCWVRRPGDMTAEPVEFAIVRARHGGGLTADEHAEAWELLEKRMK